MKIDQLGCSELLDIWGALLFFYGTWLTFTPVVMQVPPFSRVAVSLVQRRLHPAPREDQWRSRCIHVLGRIAGRRVLLHKMDGKMLEIGKIEAIQPDHGTRAVFAMVVPVPRRRQDYIASLHEDPPAMHRSKSALAFDDEPHCKGYMPVGLCSLVGHDELQPCIQGVGGERSIYFFFKKKTKCVRVSKIFQISPRFGRVTSAEDGAASIPRDGFTSMSTRRSAWCSGTSSPASRRLGRILEYLHK